MQLAEKYVPKRLTIETIYGCNASCTMCPIDMASPRKKGLMSVKTSTLLFDQMADYVKEIDKLDLFGLGEPLLDPHIFDRIVYARKKGFRNIAFSTNCDLLNPDKQDKLLESGIDTVICSIDGVKKETHERIRVNTHFDNIIRNCEQIIEKRNKGNYKTRFIMRFIRQDSNRAEWPHFIKFWTNKLSKSKNDLIIGHDMHNWTGEVASKESHLQQLARDPVLEEMACPKVFDSLVVLANGTVPLCSEDWHKASHDFGNVNEIHPMEIFNSPKFQEIRRIHLSKQKNQVNLCRECTIHYSARTRTVLEPEGD